MIPCVIADFFAVRVSGMVSASPSCLHTLYNHVYTVNLNDPIYSKDEDNMASVPQEDVSLCCAPRVTDLHHDQEDCGALPESSARSTLA